MCPFELTEDKFEQQLQVNHRRGGGHIVFGADPVGVSIGMTPSCFHIIS